METSLNYLGKGWDFWCVFYPYNHHRSPQDPVSSIRGLVFPLLSQDSACLLWKMKNLLLVAVWHDLGGTSRVSDEGREKRCYYYYYHFTKGLLFKRKLVLCLLPGEKFLVLTDKIFFGWSKLDKENEWIKWVEISGKQTDYGNCLCKYSSNWFKFLT